MKQSFWLVTFLLAALPSPSFAQELASVTLAPDAIVAPNGASFVIESRAAQRRIRKASTLVSSNAAVPSRLEGLNASQIALLEKLNRIDGPRLKRLNAVVMPAAWSDDELVFSPFPQEYRWAASTAQTIVVDQAAQAFGAYEFGQLVRWGPVSTGEGGKTPAGLFEMSWRSRGHTSSVDPSWYLEWYFNFIPTRGIAFHQYSLPGRAGSHGCVRLLQRDAEWLYNWGHDGTDAEATTVIVQGCPDASKPWQSADFLRTGISLQESPSPTMIECTGSSGAAASSSRKTVR
ncbi:MAG TPA: L,D-transpeptidase family protein [Vicinamibacterales bacterium]|nr:L,D-transpeptidase family protein [Vicinamibacterales bacterium]